MTGAWLIGDWWLVTGWLVDWWLVPGWLAPGWLVTGDWCLADWHLIDWWLVKLIDWCLVDWWLDDWWLVTGGLRLYRILSTQRCHLDGSYPGSIAIWGGAPISKELSYNPSRVDKFFTISFSTMRIFSQLKISSNKSPKIFCIYKHDYRTECARALCRIARVAKTHVEKDQSKNTWNRKLKILNNNTESERSDK